MENVELFNIPFALGENHVAEDALMPKGFARSITNFNIDNEGLLLSQAAFTSSSFTGAHSVFVTSAGKVYAVSATGDLVKAVAPGVWAAVTTMGGIVTGLGSKVWWTESHGRVYYSDTLVAGVIREDEKAYPWGVPNLLTRNANALTWVSVKATDGEESGAVLADPTGAPDEVVYKPTDTVPTSGDGADEFRDARGTALFRLNGDPSGKVCDVAGMIQFPPSAMIGLWNGRAWGVVGNYVVFSQPLRYGLHDPAYDYFTVPDAITALGAVADGMFISTKRTVYFVQGFDPLKWSLDARSDSGAYYGSQFYIPTEYLNIDALKIPPDSTSAFGWLSKNGICLGFDGGDIRVTGAGILDIPATSEAACGVVNNDGIIQIICVPA